MATAKAAITYRLLDATGVRKAYRDYITYDDAVATLSNLLTFVQSTAVLLDGLTDAQLLNSVLTLYPTLPGGLKSSPVAGSDVEESGAISYNLTTFPAQLYTEVIPAMVQAAFTGGKIDLAQTDVASWVSHQLNAALAGRAVDNNWSAVFGSAAIGRKVFRKSRKQLRRV